MAASPETAEPQGSSDTLSSPNPPSPGLHPTQESPSLTTSAPPEMANPDHATLVLPPPVDQSTVEHSEMDQLPPTPIDEAEPPPSHPPPPEAAPAASPAFEAIPPEKVASPSSLPEDVAVEFSSQVTVSAPSPSPSPSPQIVGTSPEDVPQPSSPPPPRTPPATATHASTDPSSTSAIAMASEEEAARPSPATESTDGDSRTAATPLTPPVESGPEGSLPQQQPRPPSLEMALLLCENLEPAQPLPPCHPSECRDSSPDTTVDEVVEGTFEKALPMPESTDVDMDITTGMLPALEMRSEEMLSQQQSRPPYPEMAPPQGENSKFAQSPQPPPPSESTCGWLNAATNEVSALASEEATAALEFGAERSLQEPGKTSMTSRMETEPCSPEMAPPGFKDFKSQWLPLSLHAPPAESTHNVVQVAATNQMDISPGLLPPLKSVEEGRSQQPLPGSCSPITEAAPCSPDMPPPGFENCKSSWLPVATLPPIAETTYALPDAASTKAVSFVEKACSVPALEAMDVETDRERCQLPLLESGTGNLLQGLPPRSPSPTMQAAPFSPDITPPGFKNIKLTQLQLPSPPLVQPAHVLRALVTNENMHMTSEEAPRSSSAWKAMDLDMDGTPAVAPPSESEAGKSLPPEPPLVPSHVAQHTVSSLGMVSSGSENMESSHSPLQPAAVLPLDETSDTLADAGTKTVTMEELCHPLPVTGTAEEANGSNLPPALENGREGLLPHVEPHTSSDAVHEAPTSLEIASTSFENLESSQQTSPCLAETIDPSADASATMPAIVKSDKTSLALSPLQATDTDMESATLQQLPLKSEEGSLPQPEKHPSSPSVKDTTCSPEDPPPSYETLDSLEQLPPPPPLRTKFEMGQMVCGCCRQLLAYPRGAVHVQCFGCWTINLVLEVHQVGKVYCGQCDTLLMYPFGAPAVKCSNCLFVTEIGERNVRPKISMKQSVSPRPQELAHQS